ncbi:MAG: hypothetical protein F6K10_04405 [Moorea sp. SIO2B7]|nr:hypothetical protein [Moorena sp. SIO2B7]
MEAEALNRTESILANLQKILDKIPFSSNLQQSINDIRSSIQALRPPRIMIIGRSRSGKSSLINAICGLKVAEVSDTRPETGKAEWNTYYHDGTDLVRILDTRGLQEAETPRQQDTAKTPFESIKNAIKEEYPDIILFVCKATEIHSASQEDLNICESILQEIKKIHGDYQLSVIGVLTQCDNVAPPYAKLSDNDEEKQKNIEDHCSSFAVYLKSKENIRPYYKDVIPTAAYAKYEEGAEGLILPDKDYRWNIDKLIETMMKYTPKERQGSFARMAQIKKTQLTVADTIKSACVIISGVVSINPIPGTSLPVIGIIQTFMVMYIGWLSGRSFSLETLNDFLVTGAVAAGANAGTIGIADVALKFFPGVGNVLSVAAGATATQGLGDAAIAYFLKQDQ